jgi:hypothetical protein
MKLQILDELRKNIIEFQGQVNGYECAIIFQVLGHRCGYVKLKNNSRLIGLDNAQLDELFNVHGGFTWDSGSPIIDDKNSHWIGFDCAHSYDKSDLETLKSYNKEYNLISNEFISLKENFELSYGEIRTYEYVLNELKLLTKQLKKEERK